MNKAAPPNQSLRKNRIQVLGTLALDLAPSISAPFFSTRALLQGGTMEVIQWPWQRDMPAILILLLILMLVLQLSQLGKFKKRS